MADDLDDVQEGIGSHEPEGGAKRRHAARSAPATAGAVSKDVTEIKVKKSRSPKIKADQKRHAAKKNDVRVETIEESSGVATPVEIAPQAQAEAAPEQDKIADAAAPAPEAAATEKPEVPQQEPDMPLNQEVMEPGWKFEEKETAESSQASALAEEDKDSDRMASEREPGRQIEASAMEAKDGDAELHKEQRIQESNSRKRALKYAIAALVIIIIIGLIAFYAFGHINFKTLPVKTTVSTTALTSISSTTTVPAITVQIRNLTAKEVANPSGNSTVQVTGLVSPGPKTANSVVVVSISGPNGAQLGTAEVPVSSYGLFNLSLMAGGSSGWPSGIYTVTSDYYGASGRTTFPYTAPASNPSNAIVNALCSIYDEVHSIVFLLSILLVIFGAAIYAFGHVMPGAHKGQFQGYGMGIVIGGIVGTIIAVIVPYILKIIAGGALPIASCISSIV